MQDKLNQFILNLQGQFVEVSDRTNIYQCMDLAYLWVFALGYPKSTIQKLYASEVFTQPTDLTRQYFDLLPNTPAFIPQDGDIAVFSNKVLLNGSYVDVGHIGVALGGGTVSYFRCFEQNWPIGTYPAIRLRNYNTPKLLGVLRPKVFAQPVSVTDQSKYDFGEGFGIMELQAARSVIQAQKSNTTDLKQRLTNGATSLRELANQFEG
jgi:hypothetical protein